MIMFHPREKRLPYKWKPKNVDTNKNPAREMPPEMMETPPFPGIPTAVLGTTNAELLSVYIACCTDILKKTGILTTIPGGMIIFHPRKKCCTHVPTIVPGTYYCCSITRTALPYVRTEIKNRG